MKASLLAGLLSAFLGFLPVVAAQDASSRDAAEEEARALFERAKERVVEGHYGAARLLYEKIVRRYPETSVAEQAKRRSQPSAFLGWSDVLRHGPSANRVDVVMMGDGYVIAHQDMIDDLAEFIPSRFEKQRAFREYFRYFNFVHAHVVSAENGVDGFGREYDTALGGRTRSTYAGHVGIDYRAVRKVLAELPEHDDLAIVFVKNGILGTGASGIATIGGMGARVTLHEWGHAFARLSDEYSTKTHERGQPGRGINVTPDEDPAKAPWAHWLEARVPGIGMYEGGAGQVSDVWKPTASGCLMNDGEFLCRVCREAVVLRIYSLVDPIDGTTPPAPDSQAGLLLRDEPLDFEVRVMRPETHELEVRWWLLPERAVPLSGPRPMTGEAETRYSTRRYGDRRDRGPLAPIREEPTAERLRSKNGVHRLRVRPADLETPGRYRLICRVKDTARPWGEKWPWVLKDEHGVLESECGWWIYVREPRR